jgi:hypothetical protein
MDDQRFWKIIQDSWRNLENVDEAKQCENLMRDLRQLPPQDILAFRNKFLEKRSQLNRWDLAALHWIIHQGPSDDFHWFCDWIISQGQDCFNQIQNRVEAIGEFAEPGYGFFNLTIADVAPEVYRQRTGQLLPVLGFEVEPEETPWEIEDLPQLYPSMWMKFCSPRLIVAKYLGDLPSFHLDWKGEVELAPEEELLGCYVNSDDDRVFITDQSLRIVNTEQNLHVAYDKIYHATMPAIRGVDDDSDAERVNKNMDKTKFLRRVALLMKDADPISVFFLHQFGEPDAQFDVFRVVLFLRMAVMTAKLKLHLQGEPFGSEEDEKVFQRVYASANHDRTLMRSLRRRKVSLKEPRVFDHTFVAENSSGEAELDLLGKELEVLDDFVQKKIVKSEEEQGVFWLETQFLHSPYKALSTEFLATVYRRALRHSCEYDGCGTASGCEETKSAEAPNSDD